MNESRAAWPGRLVSRSATAWLRDHSSRVMTAAILALLYLGRSVLIPLALAIMLSLLVAPSFGG